MKILVNDHSGHSFTLSLSKQLAINNNVVLHCFSKNFQSPKGFLSKMPLDPKGLFYFPLVYKNKFSKYSLFKRGLQELHYARMLIRIISSEKPDIVLCANTPLIAQQKILLYCKKNNIPFIFWCQDLYSVAIKRIALKKIGALGRLVALPFEVLEKYQLKHSNSIISITDDFKEEFKKLNLKTPNYVIPNWSPINEFRFSGKKNEFSDKFNLDNSFNIIYSGTLGYKHNPELIVEVSKMLAVYDDIKVVVVSEGLGANFLEKEKSRFKLENLIIIPFQEFDKFSLVLSTADVFLALLEPEAGQYSVPSKILSYLCAGKPIFLAAPSTNLASKIVSLNNAGKCISDNSSEDLVSAILNVKENASEYALLSKNARHYAEQNFKVEEIAAKFVEIMQRMCICIE